MTACLDSMASCRPWGGLVGEMVGSPEERGGKSGWRIVAFLAWPKEEPVGCVTLTERG